MAHRSFNEIAVLLRENDSVAVLKRPVKAGAQLVNGAFDISAAQTMGPGHKIALGEIPEGWPVRKYGQTIGFARGRIGPGEHVHTHNLELKEFGRDYQFCADAIPVDFYPTEQMRYFQGYSRCG